MKVIIYGKDPCSNCDKARLLCQMQSLAFEYRHVGADISIEDLQLQVGHPVRAVPQIFIDRGGAIEHVGGYEELRLALHAGTYA